MRGGQGEDLIFVEMNRKMYNARLINRINRGEGLVMKRSICETVSLISDNGC